MRWRAGFQLQPLLQSDWCLHAEGRHFNRFPGRNSSSRPGHGCWEREMGLSHRPVVPLAKGMGLCCMTQAGFGGACMTAATLRLRAGPSAAGTTLERLTSCQHQAPPAHCLWRGAAAPWKSTALAAVVVACAQGHALHCGLYILWCSPMQLYSCVVWLQAAACTWQRGGAASSQFWSAVICRGVWNGKLCAMQAVGCVGEVNRWASSRFGLREGHV